MSNFTAGRRREGSSAAFGKVAVGNELLGNAFFSGAMPFIITEGQAARLVSLAMQQSCRLHDGEVYSFRDIFNKRGLRKTKCKTS